MNGLRSVAVGGCLSLTLGLGAVPASAAPTAHTSVSTVLPVLTEELDPPRVLTRDACDPACPSAPPRKFAARKYRKNKMGAKRVFSADKVFANPRAARRLIREDMVKALRRRWGVHRRDWPYTPRQGVRKLMNTKSCRSQGKDYSPYHYGIGVCQSKRPDLNISTRRAAEAAVMIACAAGPAYVIATAGSATPIFVAITQGTGCGFAAWLAAS